MSAPVLDKRNPAGGGRGADANLAVDLDADRLRAPVRQRPVSATGRAGTVSRTPVLPVAAPRVSPTTRWMIGAAGALLVVAIAAVAWQALSDATRFPVSNVDVLGTLDYTDRAALQARVAEFTDDGFYTLDIDALRNEVESFPWVAQARIAREWPGRVKITVEEHEPAARWNDDALVSKRLELFRPPQLSRDDVRFAEWQRIFASLPELRGADGRQSVVLEDFRHYERTLGALGLNVRSLVEDDRLSQTLELGSNLTLRLGYEEHEHRLARFVDVYPRLSRAIASDPATFDMRYRDGFALAGARAL